MHDLPSVSRSDRSLVGSISLASAPHAWTLLYSAWQWRTTIEEERERSIGKVAYLLSRFTGVCGRVILRSPNTSWGRGLSITPNLYAPQHVVPARMA
jgi:hypothetical protein